MAQNQKHSIRAVVYASWHFLNIKLLTANSSVQPVALLLQLLNNSPKTMGIRNNHFDGASQISMHLSRLCLNSPTKKNLKFLY